MEEIKLEFLLNGKLFIDYEGGVEPVESGQFLKYIGSKVKRINNINDLTGLVLIKKPSDALNFVRLKTSPKTFYLLDRANGENMLEIIPRENIDAQFVFGDKNLAKELKSYKNGRYCICEEKILKSYSIETAKVVQEDGTFHVERTVIFKNKKNNRLKMYLIKENVTSKGTYKKISSKELVDKYKKWIFPMFE